MPWVKPARAAKIHVQAYGAPRMRRTAHAVHVAGYTLRMRLRLCLHVRLRLGLGLGMGMGMGMAMGTCTGISLHGSDYLSVSECGYHERCMHGAHPECHEGYS